jgi:probable rRNA maturation factor
VNLLTITNRQGARPVNLPELRRIGRTLLEDLMKEAGFDISIYLVGAGEITRLNEAYLRHQGPTDVITFDYAEDPQRSISSSSSNPSHGHPLHGEIFICLDEALLQARRFRTTWQSELVRYVVHGVLHLCGYTDQLARQRRQMKSVENHLLRQLARKHKFRALARP